MRHVVAKKKKKPAPPTELNIGDIVELPALPGFRGKVIEYRGPIGSGGRELYRIRLGKWRHAPQIEVPANQTVVIRTAAERAAAKAKRDLEAS